MQSIKRRTNIPSGLAYRLWEAHLRRLLDYAAEIPTWFVHYNSLLDQKNKHEEVHAAFTFFELDVSDERLDTIIKAVVKLDMNHGQKGPYHYPPSVAELWDELTHRHEVQTQTSFNKNVSARSFSSPGVRLHDDR